MSLARAFTLAGIAMGALAAAMLGWQLARHPAAAAGRANAPGYGAVVFPTSCAPAVQARLETALARLHAFDGPEEAFVAVARADPGCAVAWWGAAMAVRGNPLAGPPDDAVLRTGRNHLAKARTAAKASDRERGLVAALGAFYADPGSSGDAARAAAYEAAMERLAVAYPDDPEIQSIAALAVLEAVDLTDRSYARQLKAGAILERVWEAHPDHAGAPHYLIHAYDYAPIAGRGLPAARRYAGIAPASAHAQHMPSHVYSMLGLWEDSIRANHASERLIDPKATCGRLDATDPHALDFIAYARLQIGQDDAVAAALGAAGRSEERIVVTARYHLERGDWAGAARIPVGSGASALDLVTVRFARAIGAGRGGGATQAAGEAAALRALKPAVERRDGAYWAGLVDVYGAAAEAWAAAAAGRPDEALVLMNRAADLDDAREKHILLENKLLPMRELLGELLLELGSPEPALAAFQMAMTSAPNRLRGFLGAARASDRLGRRDAAAAWYGNAVTLTRDAAPGRPEIVEARAYRP